MCIANLPPEIFREIISHVSVQTDLFSLARTSKRFYNMLVPEYLDYFRIGCMPHIQKVWDHLLNRTILCQMVKELSLYHNLEHPFLYYTPFHHIPESINLPNEQEIYIDPFIALDCEQWHASGIGFTGFIRTWPVDFQHLSSLYQSISHMRNLKRMILALEVISDEALRNIFLSLSGKPLDIFSLDTRSLTLSDSHSDPVLAYVPFPPTYLPALTKFACTFRNSMGDWEIAYSSTRCLARLSRSISKPNLTHFEFEGYLPESLFLELTSDDLHGMPKFESPNMTSFIARNRAHLNYLKAPGQTYTCGLEGFLTRHMSLTSLEIIDAVISKPFSSSSLLSHPLAVFRTLCWSPALKDQVGITKSLFQLDIAGIWGLKSSSVINIIPNGFSALKTCVLPSIHYQPPSDYNDKQTVKTASVYLTWLPQFVLGAPNLEVCTFYDGGYYAKNLVMKILQILTPLKKLTELNGLLLMSGCYELPAKDQKKIFRACCRIPSLSYLDNVYRLTRGPKGNPDGYVLTPVEKSGDYHSEGPFYSVTFDLHRPDGW